VKKSDDLGFDIFSDPLGGGAAAKAPKKKVKAEKTAPPSIFSNPLGT